MGREQKSIDFEYSIDAFHYDLPPELIAQEPVAQRDDSRLLALNRQQGTVEDLRFPDIMQYLQPHDLLVVNDTKVFPARIVGKKETGGRIELFLLEYPHVDTNQAHRTDKSSGRLFAIRKLAMFTPL